MINQIGLMLASATLTHVSDIATGLATVADGEEFIVDPVTGADGQVYRRVGAEAEFLGWYHSGSGVSGLAMACVLRNEQDRADYEYHFDAQVNGQFVINTGTVADSCPQPGNQMFGASGIMFDGDGVENGKRLLWPSGVANRDGREECIRVTFPNVSDEHHLVYKWAFEGLPQGAWKFVAGIRMDTPEPLIFGSTHASVGERVPVTPNGAFQDYEVDVTWGSASAYSVAVRPDGTLPMVVDFDRVEAYPQGVKVPSLEEARAIRLAGHASPPFAVPGQITVTDGAFIPTAQVSALHAELPGTEVTDFRMSGYFTVEDHAYSGNIVHAMCFPQEVRPGTANMLHGGISYTVAEGETEHRMFGYAGGNTTSWPSTNMPDTVLVGFGEHRVDVLIAGDAADAAQQAYQFQPGWKRYRIFINAIEHCDIPAAPLPSGFAPKALALGGSRQNVPKTADKDLFLRGAIRRPRLDTNEKAAAVTYDQIKAEFLRDKENGLVNPQPITFALVSESDSTGRFPGSPLHYTARQLAAPGRVYPNLSQGGSYFHDSPGAIPPTNNAFNRQGRIDMRRQVLDAVVNVNECPFTIYLWHGGENNPSHLSDPASAYNDIKSMFVDGEAALFDDPNGRRVIPVIVDVRPSARQVSPGVFEVDPVIDGWKTGFNYHLANTFTVPTPVPYLWKSPDPAATGFVYLVKLSEWIPVHPDNPAGYADWKACVEASPNETIVDGQHWGSPGGGIWAARDVFVPSVVQVAADHGVTL